MAVSNVDTRRGARLPTIFESAEEGSQTVSRCNPSGQQQAQAESAAASSAAPAKAPAAAPVTPAATQRRIEGRVETSIAACGDNQACQERKRKSVHFAAVKDMVCNRIGLKRVKSENPVSAAATTATAGKPEKIILSPPALDERFVRRRQQEQRYAAIFLQHVTDAAWKGLEAARQPAWPFVAFIAPVLTAPRFNNIRLVARTALQDAVRTKKTGMLQYLHANTVDIAGTARFIASQKPTRAELPGFMRMLRNEKVAVILDLTKPEENPDSDADPAYCPPHAGQKKNVGPAGQQVAVSCIRVRDCHAAPAAAHPDGSAWAPGELVEQDLQIGGGLQRHAVRRLHFSGWPDQGTISEARLIALADKVEALNDRGARPTLIHCMAGIGRTGTLICFIAARNRIAQSLAAPGGFCDHATIVQTARAVVTEGRRDRGPGFVQTEDQFRLIVMALTKTFAHRMPSKIGPLQVAVPLVQQRRRRQPILIKPLVETGRRPRVEFKAESSIESSIEFSIGPSVDSRIDPVLVGANTGAIHCPRKTAIRVRMHQSSKVDDAFIHANAIRYPKQSLATKPGVVGFKSARTVAAGQSPQAFHLCERFLLQGLDSGKGLLQFVSPSTHHQPHLASEKTILSQLQDQMRAAAEAGRDLILGGRFKVTGLDDLRDSGNPVDSANDYARFRLTVSDVNHPGRTRTAILTQAGLKFDDNLLDAGEIERANVLAEAHDRLNPKSSLMGQSGPMIISYSGIGRNATLIAYREALARFKDAGNLRELDTLIDQIVAIGRRDRGPHFVHSEQQLSTLRRAVHQAFMRQQRTAGPGAGRGVRGVRVQADATS